MNPWTQKTIEEMIRRFEAGESATTIGIALLMTRNAIIGKLHRLGYHRDRPAGEVQIRPRSAPQRPPPPPPKIRVKPLPSIPKADPTRMITLLELCAGECHWPYVIEPDPDDQFALTHRFCGAPIDESGAGYCPYHRHRAKGASSNGPRKNVDKRGFAYPETHAQGKIR